MAEYLWNFQLSGLRIYLSSIELYSFQIKWKYWLIYFFIFFIFHLFF